MKIILRKNHESLGKVGDILEVKDGFARNYLIPREVALWATPQNLKVFEQEKKKKQFKQNKDKKEAQQLAAKLKNISLTATVAVGEEDKVFGAVTSQTIADLIVAKGLEVDRRKIQLEEPIKALGVYEVAVKLHSDVDAKIKVWVVKE